MELTYWDINGSAVFGICQEKIVWTSYIFAGKQMKRVFMFWKCKNPSTRLIINANCIIVTLIFLTMGPRLSIMVQLLAISGLYWREKSVCWHVSLSFALLTWKFEVLTSFNAFYAKYLEILIYSLTLTPFSCWNITQFHIIELGACFFPSAFAL